MNWKNSARLECRHSGASRNLYTICRKIPAFAGMTVMMLSFPALAEEKIKEPSAYSPPGCEFSVTFPSTPYTTRRCDENDKEKCYDMVSYTQVFDFESTVNFRVTCNPIDTAVYEHYSPEVMEATLRAMTNRSVVKTFDTSFRAEDGFKQAGLVGEGKSGTMPTIYIAQLWIGRGSALSVEAEMLGESHQKADELLSETLKSVHYLTDAEKKAKIAAAAGETSKEEKKKDEPEKEEPKEEKKEEAKGE